jgi:release factor glutamine methyltransferase
LSSVRDLYLKGLRLLRNLPPGGAALDSRLLLMKSAGLSAEEFLARPARTVSAAASRRFLKLIGRRRSGTPLAYLTGEKEFWKSTFVVRPGVLIPRPETEFLVEKAVELTGGRARLIIDIGTGSGNISVSLAKEMPKARIFAGDISRRALQTAKLNAGRQKADRIIFVEGSLFAPLKGRVMADSADLIVSNPPYVPADEWPTLQPEIRLHEPKRALVAGKTGLEFIRRLIRESRVYLKPGGLLLFEIGHGQSRRVRLLFDSGWTEPLIFRDLAGVPRVVASRKKECRPLRTSP